MKNKAITQMQSIIIIAIIAIAAIVGVWYYTTLSDTGTSPSADVQIAFIAEGELLDGSFYEAQSKDLQQLDDDREDIEVSFAEFVEIADFQGVAANYAEDGYDLIIAGSFGYREGAIAAAALYPDAWFGVVGGNVDGSNVLSFDTWPHEPYYLCGIIAAMMTETDIIGTIGTFENPTSSAAINGFIAGAQSVNPDITHLISWSFSWFDPARAYELAVAQVEQGADIICGQGSGNVLGVFDAAEDEDFYTFGMILDQNYLAPNHILTSSVQTYYPAFEEIVNLLQAEELEGRTYGYFMAEGASYLASYIDAVPQDVRDAVSDVQEQIMLGNLVVPLVTDRILD
jgi:basic membrane protein A